MEDPLGSRLFFLAAAYSTLFLFLFFRFANSDPGGWVQELAKRNHITTPVAIQKGTRVLISLWDSLMFGRVPGDQVQA